MFESLRGLFNKYWEMKMAARGGKTSFPSASKFETPEAIFDPRKAMDIVEDAKAFVGDVDLYLERMQWWESTILLSHHLPPGDKRGDKLSGEQIRQRIREMIYISRIERRPRIAPPPAILKHREYVNKVRRLLCGAAEDHFIKVGYIKEGWKPPTERRFGD